MARTKRIFISDIHLSSLARYNAADEMKRARFVPQKHKARLVNFLNKSVLEKESEVKDLVLAGDIFDDWVCPPDEAPPTFKEIFTSNYDLIIERVFFLVCGLILGILGSFVTSKVRLSRVSE